MPNAVATLSRKSNVPAIYVKLRGQVKAVLLLGQQRIEQEKVRTYWETGRLINEHVLLQKNRSEYGKETILKLSKDLNLSESLLWRCVQFVRAFPILATRRESLEGLSWSHYRQLMTIPDEKRRLELTARAKKQAWSSDDLSHEFKKIKIMDELSSEKSSNPPGLLKPIRGALYTYRLRLDEIIQSAEPALRVDLGFSCYQEINTKGFAEGDIVETAPHPRGAGTGYRLEKSTKASADLFTFKAYVERVIDGDTLVVQVDLGLRLWTRQTLRLRGIDCPELDAPEGKRAKKFVENVLASVPHIIISSTKSDKYDRYLADIFYLTKSGEQFLNNKLLENRLAVRA